ncbi:MAG: homoserine dehydrogenase [Alphaproteobacteria bacterium]
MKKTIHSSSPFRIIIAGLGHVALGLIQLLETQKEQLSNQMGRPINIVAVAARDNKKKRMVDISPYPFFTDAEKMARETDYDALIELIGGADGIAPAIWHIAIEKQKTIITANKALLAERADEFISAIEKHNSQLYFEAAVMGGVPIIDAMKNALPSLMIDNFYGILNGTCNYILSNMAKKNLSFAEVLQTAQHKGYAESDPSFDIDGIDALHKLVILTMLGFGILPDIKKIATYGIRDINTIDIHYAALFNFSIKLFAIAKKESDGMVLSVEPILIEKNRIMAKVGDSLNAINIESKVRGPLLFIGHGAGGNATGSAVLADIVMACHHQGKHILPFGRSIATIKDNQLPIKQHGNDMARFYLRFSVTDKVGVLASFSSILRDENISIEKLHQNDDHPVHIAIITHSTSRHAAERALAEIKKRDSLLEEPVILKLL